MSTVNNKRILVTGGAGFIGSNFVHYWHAQHPADYLLVLDALNYAGRRQNLQPLEASGALHFVHGSICDEALVARLLAEHAIDTIVHFAAESHVDRSISGPDPFISSNIVGTHVLLKQACKAWLGSARGTEGTRGANKAKPHRFHHVSTDEVFGSLPADAPPATETAPYAPNSPYAASKAAADHLVRAYHRTYGLNVTSSNCSNNYGPFQFPEKLIPLCLLNILQGRELPIYGDGQQVRDWLHVDDHCRGLDLVINQGEPGETYNIGASNEQTNLETVKQLCEIVDRRFAAEPTLAARCPVVPAVGTAAPAAKKIGSKRINAGAASLIRFVPDRPGHDTRYALDPAKITTRLGFRPQVDFSSGLEQTVDWYLSNESWWRGEA